MTETTRREPRAKNAAARREGPITREELERVALAYLNRFDSTRQNLRRILLGYLAKAAGRGEASGDDGARRLIDELLVRYTDSGLVDDVRYASILARGLRAKGRSRQAIVGKLRARGVNDEAAAAALERTDAETGNDPELAAARALVRRRKLGPHRPPDQRAEHRRRDLGALARAGFSFDVARRALATGDDDGPPDADDW